MLKKNILASAVAFIAAVSAPQMANAITATATMAVSANVVPACTLSVTPLPFGTVISSTIVNSTATISVNCGNTVPYTLLMNAGGNASGGTPNLPNRRMVSLGNFLNYNVYMDSGYTSVWPTTTCASGSCMGTGTGGAQSITVYGQVPSQAGLVIGTYADTITLTITY